MSNNSNFLDLINTITDLIYKKAISGFSLTLAIAFLSMQWFDLAGFFFLIAVVFFINSYLMEKKKKTGAQFELPLITEKIKRTSLANKVIDGMFGPKGKSSNIHIVTGTSGAGKSTLLSNDIKPKLNINYEMQTIIIDKYASVDDTVIEGLKTECGIKHADNWQDGFKELKDKKILFAFDQFESIFFLENPNATKQLLTMCEILQHCKTQKHHKCLLIIRKEWVCNLKFFEEFIPNLSTIHVVEGFGNDDESRITENIKKQMDEPLAKDIVNGLLSDCSGSRNFNLYYTLTCGELKSMSASEVLNPERSADTFKNVLPIELSVLRDSFVFREQTLSLDQIDYKKIGKRDAIHYYFDAHLSLFAATHPHPNFDALKGNAARILFSLCVNPRFRRPLSDIEIMHLTHLSYRSVRQVLKHFSEKTPHLRKIGRTTYDWYHDFYAEKFYEVSGTFLDPMERDNISVLSEKLEDSTKKSQPIQLPDIVESNNENAGTYISEDELGGAKIGFSVFTVSAIILMSRTFLPSITSQLSALLKLESLVTPFPRMEFSIFSPPRLDLMFLPIAVSLILWSWYVTTFYRRLLAYLPESKNSRRFSKFTTYWSLLCVIFTVIAPAFWITFIGFGGFVVGLKCIRIDKSLKHKINRTRFGDIGKETITNSIIMMAGGYVYYRMIPPGSFLCGSDLSLIIFLTTLSLMVIMYIFAVEVVINPQISENRAPQLLGTFKRYF